MAQRVVVTGASRGLGLGLVRQYAAAGATVFAGARRPGEGPLAQLAAGHPGSVVALPLDVADEAQRQAFVAAVAERTDAVDLLVHNAGRNAKGATVHGADPELLLALLATNAVGPARLTGAFLPLLRAGTRPVVAAISSQMGSFGWNADAQSPAYGASKAALNFYVRALARELPDVVTLAVHPGWVRTDMGGPSAPLSPEASVSAMRALFAAATPAHSGGFFRHDGTSHPW